MVAQLLRNTRKTGTVSSAPPKRLASSFTVRRRRIRALCAYEPSPDLQQVFLRDKPARNIGWRPTSWYRFLVNCLIVTLKHRLTAYAPGLTPSDWESGLEHLLVLMFMPDETAFCYTGTELYGLVLHRDADLCLVA